MHFGHALSIHGPWHSGSTKLDSREYEDTDTEEHIKKCYIQNEQFNIKTVEFIYMDMFPSQKQIAEWDAEFQEYKKKKKEK